MKLSSFFSMRALRLAACAALFACISQPAFARDNNATNSAGVGRLVIRRSAVLGYNVSVAIYIDGKPAGTLRRNHSFETHLAPGRHTLVASPNRSRGEWQTTLNVHAGETYVYTASYNVNKIVLTPATMSR
jgi:hypothetical protein